MLNSLLKGTVICIGLCCVLLLCAADDETKADKNPGDMRTAEETGGQNETEMSLKLANRFHRLLHQYCRHNGLELRYRGPLARGHVAGVTRLGDYPEEYIRWDISSDFGGRFDEDGAPVIAPWFTLVASEKAGKKNVAIVTICNEPLFVFGDRLFVSIEKGSVGPDEPIAPLTSTPRIFAQKFVGFAMEYPVAEQELLSEASDLEEVVNRVKREKVWTKYRLP